jgi:hypothetical protein
MQPCSYDSERNRGKFSLVYPMSIPKSYYGVSFTDEEIFEILDFFKELRRLDEKGKHLDAERLRLAAVLRTRTRQLVEMEKTKLVYELHSLEKFEKF